MSRFIKVIPHFYIYINTLFLLLLLLLEFTFKTPTNIIQNVN